MMKPHIRLVPGLCAYLLIASTGAQENWGLLDQANKPAVNPSARDSAASSPINKIVTPDGATVQIKTPNATIGARPENAPGGVYNMPPTTAFWVNHNAIMKPIIGATGPRVVWLDSQEGGIRPQPSGEGAFRTFCGPSHMGRFDPLVFPGRPEAGHLHTFFGNSDITGLLDDNDMINLPNIGRSTCQGGTLNRTGYWVSSLIDTITGMPIISSGLSIYYKAQGRAEHPDRLTIVPPPGLRIIGGNPAWTTGQNRRDLYHWDCSTDGTGDNTTWDHIPTADDLAAHPHKCIAGGTLDMSVVVPSCWDGINLDSPGHQSHVANEDLYGAGCPATHPLYLPQISPTVSYKVNDVGGRANIPNLRLSSDNYPMDRPGGYSMHLDWINGWDQSTMQDWVNNCDRYPTDCHTGGIDNWRTFPYRALY